MTRLRASLPLSTYLATCLVILGWVCAMTTPTEAQLGSLVVTMTSPSSGSTVSGTVPVSANVTIVGLLTVAGVQFKLDGVNLGAEDTTKPYSVAWSTVAASNGSHTLTAAARDGLGFQWTSNQVTVTVFNDVTPPAVAIASPANGATVGGTVSITANASDNVDVAGVRFQLDGADLGAEDTTAPYSVSWNTTTATNGSHTLTAIARDAAGNSANAAAVTVTVANQTGGTSRIEETSAAVAFVGPWMQGYAGGYSWSGGTAALGSSASQRATLSFNGTGVRWIGFRGPQTGVANVYLDGTLAGTVDAYAATEAVQAVLFTANWPASAPHTLEIEVTHTKNAASSDYFVVVDAFDLTGAAADTTPPTVAISTPAAGSTVSGPVPITANASDNGVVAGVRFLVDGAQLGAEDTASPYSVNWDTTTASDGSHSLTAVARDGVGNMATSAAVTVTVSNASPPPVIRATRFENTDPAILYTDGCSTCGQSPTWFHGSRSRAWSAGTSSFNRSTGARGTFTFTGTSVTWIGFRAPWAGIARVYVDGAFVAELDLYTTTEQVQTPVFSASGLTSGSHTLAVESTGLKNASSADYAVVVDAFDVSPASPPTTQGTRLEESSGSTTFSANWTAGDTSRAWSGGTAAFSTTPGARATFTFTGTSVSWVGLRGPQTGIARIYLDGAFQATVDTYSPADVQAAVYMASGLAPARHRLEVEATGLKNAASSNSLVFVDAFDIRARLEETDPSVVYTGSWVPHNTDRAWSGNTLNTGAGMAARSGTLGARAELSFTGTSVTWIGFRGPWLGMADVVLDGGPAQRIDLYSATEAVRVPVFTRDLAPGTHTLRIDVPGEKNPASTGVFVMVDAFDVGVPEPAPAVTRTQETGTSIAYSGSWAPGGVSPLWSGENATQATTVGARATVTFTGTSIRWLGERGFATGVARVLVDGVLVAQVDTRTPLQEEYQEALFRLSGLTFGSHTLTIEVIGRANEPPGATVERVVVDAFDVY